MARKGVCESEVGGGVSSGSRRFECGEFDVQHNWGKVERERLRKEGDWRPGSIIPIEFLFSQPRREIQPDALVKCLHLRQCELQVSDAEVDFARKTATSIFILDGKHVKSDFWICTLLLLSSRRDCTQIRAFSFFEVSTTGAFWRSDDTVYMASATSIAVHHQPS